jgi:hypothetical protein
LAGAVVSLAAEAPVVRDEIEDKRNLLIAEMLRYFGETRPALAARWAVAIVGLPTFTVRELAVRLQTLEAVASETNRELGAARAAVTKGQASAAFLLDRALASIEHLSEVAQAMTRQLEDLLRSHPPKRDTRAEIAREARLPDRKLPVAARRLSTDRSVTCVSPRSARGRRLP